MARRSRGAADETEGPKGHPARPAPEYAAGVEPADSDGVERPTAGPGSWFDDLGAEPRPGASRFVRDGAVIIAIALVASALLRGFVIQAFTVPTGSMRDTISLNQRIAVEKFGSVQRGQVVVFEDPGDWITPGEQDAGQPGAARRALEWMGLLPSSADNHLVKRVIGMPGDEVACCDRRGRVTVNGSPLDESAYLFPGDRPSEYRFDVVVPAGTMWVMGDHRSRSGDSRCHLSDDTAFVPLDLVTGRVVAVVWPLDQMHALGIPDTFDAVPRAGPAPTKPVVKTISDCGTG